MGFITSRSILRLRSGLLIALPPIHGNTGRHEVHMISYDSTSPTVLCLFYIIQGMRVVTAPKGESQSQ